MNATGYSLGTTFAPNWMDWPMFYHGNPEPAAPGQVFFIHIIIFDSERQLAMTTGQTVLVGERGVETLSQRSPRPRGQIGAMPYLIIFLFFCLLGLIVSCSV